MSLRSSAKILVKNILAKAGFEIRTINSKGLGYLSAENVIRKSEEQKITVNQYLENLWGLDSHAEKIISRLELNHHLKNTPFNILEIGAGTGIYADKVIKVLGKENIALHQIYETALDWVGYLKEHYAVDIVQANGYNLNGTENNSMDLVHAHGVFVYTSFITTMSYLKEICRVTKKDGLVLFDVFDETCFDDEIINNWISRSETYPCITPEAFIMETFSSYGFSLLNSFHENFSPGRARYFLFKNTQPA